MKREQVAVVVDDAFERQQCKLCLQIYTQNCFCMISKESKGERELKECSESLFKDSASLSSLIGPTLTIQSTLPSIDCCRKVCDDQEEERAKEA